MDKNKELFLTFLKIGVCTFGGGYAMIPVIKRELVEGKKWLSEEEILDMVAVAEATPGPIAINAATFTGYKIGGICGAACATIGVALPSFFIIVILANFLRQFEKIKVVSAAFDGIRVGVLVLIAGTFVDMLRKSEKSIYSYVVIAGAFLMAGVFKVNAIIVLILCGMSGLIRGRILKK